jgi:glucokinase
VSELLLAGLDIGGTKTLAVAVSVPAAVVAGASAVIEGSIVATVRRATRGGPDEVRSSIGETLTELADAARVTVDGFAAVGLGIPGLVDREAGTVRHAVNLGLGDEPVALADHVGDLARAPVVVDNDVNMAAVGAASALRCSGDLAYLSVGTGVAAGFVLGGRIRQGAHGAAGEIGHLPVDPGGPRCECGQRGCLEAVASGTASAKRWPSAGGAATAASELLAAAAAGDGVAAEVRDEMAAYLSGAVALIAQTVDPQIIVLGGGVAEAGAPLLDAVVDALHARAERSPVLAALDLAGRVALVPDGVPAGALGAALLAGAHLAADGARLAADSAEDDVSGRTTGRRRARL